MLSKDQLAHGGYYLAKVGGICRWDNGSQRFYLISSIGIEAYTIEEFEPIERAHADIDRVPFAEIVQAPEYINNKC